MANGRPDPNERILDAAATVFAELGIAQTRMGHVADRAGYSRASLYRHFPTKEALVTAFAQRELERATAAVMQRVTPLGLLGDRLVEAMAFGIELMRDTPAIRPFLAPETHGVTLTLSVRTPELGTHLFATLLSVVAEHDGVEKLRTDLPADELLEWIVRVIVSLGLAPGRPRSPEELRAFLGRLIRPAFVVPAHLHGGAGPA